MADPNHSIACVSHRKKRAASDNTGGPLALNSFGGYRCLSSWTWWMRVCR